LGLPDKWLDWPQFQASFVGIDYANIKVREMINRWKEYVLVRECLAPEGSDRSNHKQDQAVLTALIYLTCLSSPGDGEMFDQVYWAQVRNEGEFSRWNDIDFMADNALLQLLDDF